MVSCFVLDSRRSCLAVKSKMLSILADSCRCRLFFSHLQPVGVGPPPPVPLPQARWHKLAHRNYFSSTCKYFVSTSAIRKMPGESVKCLRFVKLTMHAHTPSKGSEKAAGFDLKSAYSYVVKPRSKEMVKTDLQIMLPEGCYGRIAPRSGLAWKNSIDVGAGVIDEDYRGDVRVILFNHSDEAFIVQPGDRIAQLICERIYYPELQEVKELNETNRGSGGFGSTGKN